MITVERAKLLTSFLEEDVERAQKLLVLEPAKATEEINELGYDFTTDEIVAYGEALKKSVDVNDEISEDDLSDVSGGIGVAAAIGIGLGAGVLVGGFSKLGIW